VRFLLTTTADKVINNPMATVVITTEAKKDYKKLPSYYRAAVDEIFVRLSAWPVVSGAKPLVRDLKGHFRIRTGDYRVVFHVVGDTVIVDRIANRKEVYDG